MNLITMSDIMSNKFSRQIKQNLFLFIFSSKRERVKRDESRVEMIENLAILKIN